METEQHHFVSIGFTNFKAFKKFKIDLKNFNVLVGPNNAGKSTVLTAFRILAAAMRSAYARNPKPVGGNLGLGYTVDLTKISVAAENVFYNYDDTKKATIVFKICNGNKLTLHFPTQGECFLTLNISTTRPKTTVSVKKNFNCKIGFVPILGPVDHHEQRYGPEAARLALFNYRAARNFRNIWYHYPEKFKEFRNLLRQTWPGMDIEPPELDLSHDKPMLWMYCPEKRYPRELFWAGFGFQVWCQMLTHIIQSKESSLFLIDEPDIYLHSDLQRQLLSILRNLGPDVLIATHSTEIIAEAETNEIVLINKSNETGKRLSDPSQLTEVYNALGSNTNPILTQLAKTRKALFVEGKDFQILSKFAQKIKKSSISMRQGFVVVPVGGFKPDGIRDLKKGMSHALGENIDSMALLDKDYRTKTQCSEIIKKCKKFCSIVKVTERKEIENYILVPAAIDRLVARKLKQKATEPSKKLEALQLLEAFAEETKADIFGRMEEQARVHNFKGPNKVDGGVVSSNVFSDFEEAWKTSANRIAMIPGKQALTFLNRHYQDKFGISITPRAIIDAMHVNEVPEEMRLIIQELEIFTKKRF